jgi:hypothetical protein
MLESLQKAKSIATNANLNLDLSMIEETYKTVDTIQKNYSKENSIKNLVEYIFNSNKTQDIDFKYKFLNSRCFEPFYGMLICPEGKASHCVPYGMGIDSLDVRKLSLKEIWFSEHFEKVRKNIVQNIMMECCLKCGLLDMSKELREDINSFVKEEKI